MSPFSLDHDDDDNDHAHDHHRDALVLLRRESLDIYNRIHSIAEDVVFVEKVCAAYPELPVLPNLRCGAWYVPPHLASEHAAYFKSTDGHYNNWSFNLRRPNVHLLDVVKRYGGLLLVDATRSGKRMPDALSKTVPIWCAVVNRAVRLRRASRFSGSTHDLEADGEGMRVVYTPPAVVSCQEHRQIEERVGKWAEALADSSYTLPDLPYPLRPVWITPSTSTFPALPLPLSIEGPGKKEKRFFAVVCVSASKQVNEGVERREAGFAYVQGSGDDHELWGMGLTPQSFWEEKMRLLSASRATLPSLVSELVAQHRAAPQTTWGTLPTPIRKAGGGRLLVCAVGDVPASFPSFLPPPFAHDSNMLGRKLAYVIIAAPTYSFTVPPSRQYGCEGEEENHAETETETETATDEGKDQDILVLSMPEGKKGQAAFLHTVLPRAMPFIQAQLQADKDVCVACHSGKDASVGLVLAALQMWFDGKGIWVGAEGGPAEIVADKKSLSTRLQWIIADKPEANPSRVTLKRVNEFLLTAPALRR